MRGNQKNKLLFNSIEIKYPNKYISVKKNKIKIFESKTVPPPSSSPHDGLPGAVRVVEHLVPVGQERVALTHHFADQSRVFWTEQPRLATGGVQVGVGPEERLVSPRLVPAHQQLGARGLEETADIGYETETGQLLTRMAALLHSG